MVYVQRKGEKTATLYHGDYGWEPVTVKSGVPQGLIINGRRGRVLPGVLAELGAFAQVAGPES